MHTRLRIQQTEHEAGDTYTMKAARDEGNRSYCMANNDFSTGSFLHNAIVCFYADFQVTENALFC